MRVKRITIPVFILSLALPPLLSSCRDAIFAQIQEETKLKSAVIPGGPLDIFRHGDELYTVSGKVFHYGESTGRRWRAAAAQPPDGKAVALTGAGGDLYALTGGNEPSLSSLKLYRQGPAGGPDGAWNRPAVSNRTGFTFLQSVYGAGDKAFAGAYRVIESGQKKYMAYAILAVNTTDVLGDTFELIYEFPNIEEGALTGACYVAASQTYYLATTAGLYTYKASADPAVERYQQGSFIRLLPLEAAGTKSLMGIVRLYGSVDHIWFAVVTESSGALNVKTENASATLPGAMSSSYYLTKAAGVWKNPEPEKDEWLLLLGHGKEPSSATTYTYGYYETLLGSGLINTSTFSLHTPGSPPSNNPYDSSASSNAQYASSLGTRGINSFFQAPADIDPDMPLFAATQKDGLWSLRDVGGGRREWNVED